MNLAHLLRRIAEQDPRRAAVLVGTTPVLDYGSWAARCARLGASLRAAGLVPGDRIALFMRNHKAYLELMWGAWWAGLVIVPINAKLHPKEAAWIIEHSGARWGFIAGGVGAELHGLEQLVDVDGADYAALFTDTSLAIEPRAKDDIAWLFYTSGTTGRPKGVMITHRNLMTMGLCYFADVDSIDAADCTVYAAPMSHGAGIYAVPHVMVGARHCVPASGGFDASELFELAPRLGPMSLFAAPTMVNRLVDHAQAQHLGGDGFKTIVYGGGPMYVADIQRAMRVMGPRFVQIYGQGESPMTITALSRGQLVDSAHPRHLERIASVGVAQTAVELRVVDTQNRLLPAGEVGEVVVRGDSVMAGYWRNPEATAATLRDGWLFTGDMGCLDTDGFLTLKDRSKDVIISGGSNIYPREVEEVLLLHPGVAEASVVGAHDQEWGEVVVAFIVPRPGSAVDTHALDALCLGHIARFKRPKCYEFVDALPKNNYGKVLKKALRERLKNPGEQLP
ncbi:MAG: class I adenylate-forming enzyme family protein [Immundisolibacter sp.]|uniref:class I adenylate-forming enzyme family protein n=1 Tax=Immundisolibacter sp. TaxID=1934948 RepID=UPI003EE0F383